MLKKTLLLAGAGLALAATLSLAPGLAPRAEAATVIRYADYGPNRGSRAEALQWWADQLKQRSGGDLSVEFHWGGALLSGKATLNGLSTGVADAGTVIGFFTPSELRGYNLGDLPVDNSDEWVGLRAFYDLSKHNAAMKKEFDKANVAYLSNFTTGPIQLICTKAVKSVADLSGLKIRASGPYGKALAALGADVQRMSQADVYPALDSGVITCNQNYFYAMKAYKQYEVASYVTELDWGQNMSFGIFMNKDSYAALSEKDRKVVDAVSSDFVDHMAQVMIDELAADRAAMVKGIDGKAITIEKFSEADRAKVVADGKTQVDGWVKAASDAGLDGAALLADYEAKIKAYAAEKAAKGYPWAR
ncbi:TRAP-type C4-dicarboxylate transport system, substrate-binding protein [Tistlia consotensis]|uniref:TRAP-type C4-dicarboxylate transport system, substrate-binding protein n=1 Tax=Tistlia consotensis USBA 355 TaxID=560819 RepID=A0A1Y6CQM7_9PROT|nr:C4-dicarboxylate TRAP transporter substrate-binding protein [Tistlia consotensis]SMF68695.1 TRAP-type C4-dicarboxylate transport system, substrate-binding protein [Tistlia consotensis USBA 355]SNS01227.1 TRAP-type C4-dicarboxylate transport system, substrate-binding protein [Tistlia consotensis]